MKTNRKKINAPLLSACFVYASSSSEWLDVSMAQSPGTFVATGSMITGRYYHSATLLNNGKGLDLRRGRFGPGRH